MKRAALAIATVLVCATAYAADEQRLFATPDAAVQALVQAAKSGDENDMLAIYGPERKKLLSGDAVEDANALKKFAGHLGESATLQKVDDSKYTLLVGNDHWPSPIPIVKSGDQWRFDTTAGLEEILNRRIGQNELAAIMTCRAYVVAQWEYFTQSTGTAKDGLAVYAQRFMSTPGQRDGLYWEVADGAKPSPLGSLVADAQAAGYSPGKGKHAPYQGYYFRILKAQGPHAPGGKFSYLINGNMIAGYGLIAWPAKWGGSGVMTFIVNNQGRVYQKNLGANTAILAAGIKEYDPDPTWKLAEAP